ncbi:MAG: SpoIVB peptidase S55 domain-containing protein [Candidatus Polarisedimenticolia bacterium]
MTRLAGALLCLAASSVGAAQDSAELAQDSVQLMPLSEVRPGMRGVVRTVFEGGEPEEFDAEILGVMDDFLGPGQDLILARLKGERVQFTGVAGGMSGSPVYIDGRLVGALSYRLGVFLKEPIAGITPIQYMLDMGGSSSGGSGVTRAAAQTASGPGSFEPIETPLMVSGVPASVLSQMAPELERIGLGGAVAGGSSGSGAATAASRPLRPGDPVAAQLVTGDISFAATGTVTHVDGDQVYAFGHPSFISGAADFPMARAEIYLTLPSLQASSKLSRVLDTVGTFKESRLPGITGVLGPGPRMIPVTLEVTGAGAPRRTFHYQVADYREFTPTLVGLVTAASLVNTPWSSDEMTVALSGRIALRGHEDVQVNDLYTGFSAQQSAALSLSRDVQGLFGAVYQNRYETPHVESVNLKLSSVEQGNLGVVEAVYPTRTEVGPGETVEFRVLVRPYRGSPYTRRFSYTIPEGFPDGQLVAYIGSAGLLSSVERNVLSRQVTQADGLDQLISVINTLRTNNQLYMKITRRHAGAVVQNEILQALPPSVYSTLGGNRAAGEVTPLSETTIHEEAMPLEHIVVGGLAVPLRIR